jgi:LacI family transcriptional regulator
MAKKTLGVAIDLTWPVKHHQALVRGILEAARERGWRCVLDPYLESLAYDGVILRATRALAHRVGRIPAVNVWVNSPDRRLPRVLPDQAAGGRLAAEHLQSRGFRRFGFLGHPRDLNSRLQLDGFRSALKTLPCSTAWIGREPRTASDWRRAQRTVEAWIPTWTPPIGIFASDDLAARILADACRRRGLRLPDDVGLVGFGNEELTCEMMEPALTSVEQGFERVGRRAVEALFRPRSRPILVPPARLVERASTDVFAVDDRDVARALRVIADRTDRPLRVPEVAHAVALSRRTLERRFRASLGRSIHDEIIRAHVARAKRLLVSTEEPLKRVARLCGFRSPQQLSRVFVLSERKTPLAFRYNSPEKR